MSAQQLYLENKNNMKNIAEHHFCKVFADMRVHNMSI
jgi:hypothetical protein